MEGIRFSFITSILCASLLLPAAAFAQGEACTFDQACKTKVEKTVVPFNKQATKFQKKLTKFTGKYNKLNQKQEAIDEKFQAKIAQVGVEIAAATIDCALGSQGACKKVAQLIKFEAKLFIKWNKAGDKIEMKVEVQGNKVANAQDDLDCACNTLASVYALCPSNIPASTACPQL